MFFRYNKLIADVRRILGWVGGGVHKRIDENLEFLELLRAGVPDFVAAHPEAVGWLQSEGDLLCELADAVPITQDRFPPLKKSQIVIFRRPWPGETVETIQRQIAPAAARLLIGKDWPVRCTGTSP